MNCLTFQNQVHFDHDTPPPFIDMTSDESYSHAASDLNHSNLFKANSVILDESGEGGYDWDDQGTAKFSSSHRTSSGNSPVKSPRAKMTMAIAESMMVKRSKIALYVALSLTALAMGTICFTLLRNQEQSNFEIAFGTYGHELFDTTKDHVETTALVMKKMALSITSHVNTFHLSWANLTLPDFEVRTQEARWLSRAEVLALTPQPILDDTRPFVEYASGHQDWIRQGLDQQGLQNVDPGPIPDRIYPAQVPQEDRRLSPWTLFGHRYYMPLWQMSPAPADASILLQDLASIDWFPILTTGAALTGNPALSGFVDLNFMIPPQVATNESNTANNDSTGDELIPRSLLVQPYFDSFDSSISSSPGGFVMAALPWQQYLAHILPETVSGLVAYIDDGCGSGFTFRVDGRDSLVLGPGDLHDSSFDSFVLTGDLAEFSRFRDPKSLWLAGTINETIDEIKAAYCKYTMMVYPSAELQAVYYTPRPMLYTAFVVLLFVFTALVFAIYEYAVVHRQAKMDQVANRTAAIVSDLFPQIVQDRLLEDSQGISNKSRLQRFLSNNQIENSISPLYGGSGQDDILKTKPIADLFPECTVMFADMVGFTAWSSTRDPTQVFTLLEAVYHAFDEIARNRRVFKVETVGDCYVAVAGLPEPRNDHALIMARFARDCMVEMGRLTRTLEETLGPDTADLTMRMGLHSGPVTAGVLRGDRARFQLFGDTVNTASRMESTGQPDKIQISSSTANILRAAGRDGWLQIRRDKIKAKGKGKMSTFWLELRGDASQRGRGCETEGQLSGDDRGPHEVDLNVGALPSAKHSRLVNWTCELLIPLLAKVVTRRNAAGVMMDQPDKLWALEQTTVSGEHGSILDEVVDVINMPQYDPETARREKALPPTELNDSVKQEIHDYVETIAMLYRDNAFHNFEHVTHVTMSVVKLLSRIIAPDLLDQVTGDGVEKTLHDHTYGIASDPLTQFAVVFSALIHDVDHQGVPNAQLVKEDSILASVYKNRSIAEQNSVGIAWRLLMGDQFQNLRRAIYATEAEFRRFRQLVVNSVMATDIMDKDLGMARKERWNQAFALESILASDDFDIDRKATIVIEHLIQASDVAHTMQHWHVYRKWNQRLFEEMVSAYNSGRSEKDPSIMWYEGELGFFDYNIIPLAKKLKDCGVFGVTSAEYLTYALQNRAEWEKKGRELVDEMVEKAYLRERLEL